MKKFFFKKGHSFLNKSWFEFYKYILTFVLFFKFKISLPTKTLKLELVRTKKYLTNNIWFLKYYLRLFTFIKINFINWSVLFKYLNKWKSYILQQAIA